MMKEDEQKRVNDWVQNVVSDRWLDNLQAVKQWKDIAKIVGEEKTREEILKLLDGFLSSFRIHSIRRQSAKNFR
jgi:hypothetical protein